MTSFRGLAALRPVATGLALLVAPAAGLAAQQPAPAPDGASDPGPRPPAERPDQPQWRWSVWMGDVTSHTLENVVIDNYIFGVASVSEEGFESPVVFPGPVGAFTPLEWLEDDDG